MKALLNYSDHDHQFPLNTTVSITVPRATTEIIRGVRVRTPGIVAVSDALAAEMQAHDIMRAWFGPEGIVAVDVAEMA